MQTPNSGNMTRVSFLHCTMLWLTRIHIRHPAIPAVASRIKGNAQHADKNCTMTFEVRVALLRTVGPGNKKKACIKRTEIEINLLFLWNCASQFASVFVTYPPHLEWNLLLIIILFSMLHKYDGLGIFSRIVATGIQLWPWSRSSTIWSTLEIPSLSMSYKCKHGHKYASNNLIASGNNTYHRQFYRNTTAKRMVSL